MNALNLAEYTQTLGVQARVASALMAKAPTATKNTALLTLASLLRANGESLQAENAKDVLRASHAGLASPLLDRLKLTSKII